MKAKSKPTRKITATKKRYDGFTAEEKGAMRDRVKEMKASKDSAGMEAEVLAKIDEMPERDRVMGRRLHAIIKASAPSLSPKLWYGMPAYAKNGKIVCHFVSAQKFKTRFATFGFSDVANLDDGNMWPNSFALVKLTPDVEARIGALVKKAAS